MQSFAHAIILLWGWQRLAAAFAAGVLSAFAQAPYHAAPVLLLTLPVLVLLIDGSSAAGRHGVRRIRPAFAIGWWFGFGYFLSGLWWIGAAFLVDAETFGWMIPFAVTGLPALLALFTGAGVALARLLWVDGPFRVFALAIGLTTAELARGHLMTGFPWILIGQAAGFTDVTIQLAAVVGVYGLTALTVIVAAAPAVLADDRPRARAAVLALAAVIAAGTAGYGVVRLADAPLSPPPDARQVRIVQAGIDQSVKWSPEYRQSTLERYLALSAERGETSLGLLATDLVVWPETAMPFFLTEEPAALAGIGSLLPSGTALVTGAPRAEPAPGGRRIYNSVYVIDDGGRIAEAYDKAHLVPFGEYLPFQGVLETIGLRQLTGQVGGFSEGPGIRTVRLPGGLKAGILICYEIIFPGAASDPADRPDLLINVTNDAWYGDTPGPYQHLDLARMRAVEEGLPVVRAANTGISAIIDPYGRIPARLGLGASGVLDGPIPQSLAAPPFATIAGGFLFTVYAFSVLLLAAGRRISARKR